MSGKCIKPLICTSSPLILTPGLPFMPLPRRIRQTAKEKTATPLHLRSFFSQPPNVALFCLDIIYAIWQRCELGGPFFLKFLYRLYEVEPRNASFLLVCKHFSEANTSSPQMSRGTVQDLLFVRKHVAVLWPLRLQCGTTGQEKSAFLSSRRPSLACKYI